MAFTEALLEMHFHRAIVDAFADVFGKSVFRILKPSPQHERFLGFDQGWIRTSELSDRDLRAELTAAITNGSAAQRHFVAYFLQFKRVSRLVRHSKHVPATFAPPCFRAELDLKAPKKGHWSWSQHETLVRLQTAFGTATEVNYACPMIFNEEAIYDTVNLDLLRFVQVRTAPAMPPNTKHFIYFRTHDGPPYWCSEPVIGDSLTHSEWLKTHRRLLSTEEVLRLLHIQDETMQQGLAYRARFRRWSTADALTILELR